MTSKKLFNIVLILFLSLGTLAQDTTSVLVVADSSDLVVLDSLVGDSSLLDSLFTDSSSLLVDVDSLVPQITEEIDSLELDRLERVGDDEVISINRRPPIGQGWIFFIGLFVLIIVGLLRSLDGARHFYTVATPFGSLHSEQSFFSKWASVDLFQILLILVYSLCLSLIIQQFELLDLSGSGIEGFRMYLLILLIVLIAYIVKYFTYYLLFQILLLDKLPRLTVVSMSNLAYVCSLILLPLIIMFAFGRDQDVRFYLYSSIWIILLGFILYRFFRIMLLIWSSFSYSKIYIILYLCTLEILPVLIGIRYLILR